VVLGLCSLRTHWSDFWVGIRVLGVGWVRLDRMVGKGGDSLGLGNDFRRGERADFREERVFGVACVMGFDFAGEQEGSMTGVFFQDFGRKGGWRDEVRSAAGC
jgi:hypothetical protein